MVLGVDGIADFNALHSGKQNNEPVPSGRRSAEGGSIAQGRRTPQFK
jgi:hypothetical protein